MVGVGEGGGGGFVKNLPLLHFNLIFESKQLVYCKIFSDIILLVKLA